jgi:microcystin-dependent protein
MEPVLGMIYLFAGNFAPTGYAMCDGQLMAINQIRRFLALSARPMGGTACRTSPFRN